MKCIFRYEDLVQSVSYFGGVFYLWERRLRCLCKRYSKQLIGFAGFSSLLVLWQLAGFLNILPKFVLQRHLKLGMPLYEIELSWFITVCPPFSGLDWTCYRGSSCCWFAILMDSFQWVNDLVLSFYGCYSNHSDDCLGPYPGSLVLVMVCFQTGFDHYYGGISIVVSLLDGFGIAIKYILSFQIASQSLSDLSSL